jgi:hypothetical protein
VCNGGKEKMTETDILYPAIVIFGLLVIGLVLTVLEFSSIKDKNDKEKGK